ncbi:MAG: type II toxin-antitoxin system VapC family toxin [Moorea sp. SIOASIH]|uniref:type II toxin-antitoxin system VapC family toxin n=1 Tax=Moorena sp. SIOASIH TaxID=2607817 RepID=UPI0013B8D8FA|nr:type II toxin-antitoxin system VapC family toxin [Moorena sp. SIOASIH]NEO39717.1 type II toxin-antitoxin system VapC family toxin [Moorena sp. SIOASIH]
MSLWILDTDHLSLLQRVHLGIRKQITARKPQEIAITIISAEEQIRGMLSIIRRANSANELVLAYRRFKELLDDIATINVLDFTPEASLIYEDLVRPKIRIGTRDLRIAALVLAVKGTVVTRNQRDFNKVPGLKVEDWTVEG